MQPNFIRMSDSPEEETRLDRATLALIDIMRTAARANPSLVMEGNTTRSLERYFHYYCLCAALCEFSPREVMLSSGARISLPIYAIMNSLILNYGDRLICKERTVKDMLDNMTAGQMPEFFTPYGVSSAATSYITSRYYQMLHAPFIDLGNAVLKFIRTGETDTPLSRFFSLFGMKIDPIPNKLNACAVMDVKNLSALMPLHTKYTLMKMDVERKRVESIAFFPKHPILSFFLLACAEAHAEDIGKPITGVFFQPEDMPLPYPTNGVRTPFLWSIHDDDAYPLPVLQDWHHLRFDKEYPGMQSIKRLNELQYKFTLIYERDTANNTLFDMWRCI